MKKILGLALAGALSVAAVPTMAADRPLPYKAEPRAVPIYKWTGCYVGVQAGYANAGVSGLATNGPPPTQFLPYDYDATGGLVGGHVGCDWQFQPQWVIGIEGDWNWARLRGHQDNITDPVNFPGIFYTHTTNVNSLGSIRGRLGVLMTPSMLLYATAGWAFGKTEHTINFTGAPPPPILAYNANRSGWTAGAGLEAYVLPQVTMRLEYRYSHLGGGTVVGANVVDNIHDINVHAVLLGITWRP